MRLTSLRLTLLASTLVLSAKPPVPPPTELPSAAVEISARTLYLPPLPINAKDAHKRYPELKASMNAQLQDLEKDLIHLYGQPGACDAFLGRIQVPKDRKAETEFLVSILRDLKYEAMEKGIVENWQTWQQLVVENGFGKFTDRTENLKVMADQSLEARRYNVQTRGSGDWSDWSVGPFLGMTDGNYTYNTNPTEKEKQIDRELRALAPAPTAITPGITDPMSARAYTAGLGLGPYSPNDAETVMLMSLNWKYDAVGQPYIDWGGAFHMKMSLDMTQSRINLAIVGTRIANREIPALGKAWDPMAEYLNGIAHKLLEYERLAPAGESPELKKLRMLTKIAFLERFRGALWFDNLVWCQVTSDKLPPILQDLRPRSTDYQESAISAAERYNGNWTFRLPEAPESLHLASNQLRPLRPAPRFRVLPLPFQTGQETRPWPGVDGFIKARLQPSSDPQLIQALRRAGQDSQEFETVLKALWQEQPKVRLNLQKLAPTPVNINVQPSMGSLLVEPVAGGFNIAVLVQTGLADQGMDQVEPWLAQALYSLLAASRQDGVVPNQKGFLFDQTTVSSIWDFQRQMRQSLKTEHPEEYDIMTLDGQDGFENLLR